MVKRVMSNRLSFTLISFAIIVFMGAVVFAFNSPHDPSVMGHTLGEIEACGNGQILKTVDGTWSCVEESDMGLITAENVGAGTFKGVGDYVFPAGGNVEVKKDILLGNDLIFMGGEYEGGRIWWGGAEQNLHIDSEYGSLMLYDDVYVAGELDVGNGLNVKYDLDVNGDVNIDGILDVGGRVTVASIECDEYALIDVGGSSWSGWQDFPDDIPDNFEDTCNGDVNQAFSGVSLEGCTDFRKVEAHAWGDCNGYNDPINGVCESGWFEVNSGWDCCNWDRYDNCVESVLDLECAIYQNRVWDAAGTKKICVFD